MSFYPLPIRHLNRLCPLFLPLLQRYPLSLHGLLLGHIAYQFSTLVLYLPRCLDIVCFLEVCELFRIYVIYHEEFMQTSFPIFVIR